MGWVCQACGNREHFTEYNRVKTDVIQNHDSRIIKSTNSFASKPLIEVHCNKCQSRNIGWLEVRQDDNYQFDDDIFVSENHTIGTLVLELTNRCDAECNYCPKNGDIDLDFAIIKRILEENKLLKRPIMAFELGWDMGNPLLYSQISKVLDLLSGYGVTVITNGRHFLENAANLELKGKSIVFLLDYPAEKENDKAMGEGCFDGTIKGLSYLTKQGISCGIYMRMNQANYDKIPEMKKIADEYGANLIPTEIYPIGKAESNMWMTDEMKQRVLADIESLRLFRSIHFSEALPMSGCTYLRSQRMVIGAHGNLSFCHFFSSLPNSTITDARELSLLQLIQRNNKVRNGFLRNKQKRFSAWKKPRETSSPCSYCLHAFGMRVAW